MRPLSVLVLADDRRDHAANVLEHIDALRRFSRHRVDVVNPRGLTSSRLLRLQRYDVVVIHYTLLVVSDTYLAPWFREQIAAFRGLKVQFLQDEYRWVDAITERMRELGIDLLFSVVPEEVVPQIYGPRVPGVDVLTTLAGFVPTELEGRPRPPLAGRPLDVAYRGRAIPYWLGRLGQEKVHIGREFLARARSTDLRCDIGWTEADRIYGEAWYRFLASSRTTLGTESGASIVDFDGTLQTRTDRFLAERPTASFEDAEREILGPYEGNAQICVVSPRVFEAAAVGTVMVNFVGRYSGTIEPWTHYVPLAKDFSNFDEVVAAIRDDALLERLAARAHEDLVASGDYSLRRFVGEFDDALVSRAGASRAAAPGRIAHGLLGLEQRLTPARRADLPLAVAARRRSLENSGQRLIHRFPAIESLGRTALADATPQQQERIRYDLVRLAAACAAHLRVLRHYGRPFDVLVELDDDSRRLLLLSTLEQTQSPEERERVRVRLEQSIRDGRLEEIIWNHSNVGYALTLPFAAIKTVWLEIGYHLVYGAHRFSVLGDLARRDPEGVLAALEPIFRPRPSEPVDELPAGLMLLPRLVSAPGPVAMRSLAALRAVVTTRELRTLMVLYLRSRETRAAMPFDRVLEDLFKLRLVGEVHTQMDLETDERGVRLVYTTAQAATDGNGMALDRSTAHRLQLIEWDNSAIGPRITSRRRPHVTVTLDDGVHRFEALAVLARRFPTSAARALRRASRCA